MLPSLVVSIVASALIPSQVARIEPAQRITADVVITRLTPEQWRVDYTFDVPVGGITYGPPAAAFREQAWHVDTPGVQLIRRDEREALIAGDSARSRFSIVVDRYTRYAPDHYAPFIPYSDGGAALYLGFFAGDAVVDAESLPVDYRFHFVGLPDEHDDSWTRSVVMGRVSTKLHSSVSLPARSSARAQRAEADAGQGEPTDRSRRRKQDTLFWCRQ